MFKRALILERPYGAIDLTSCAQYGTITYLFPDGAPAANNRSNLNNRSNFAAAVVGTLEAIDYDTDNDVFVIVGKLNKVAAACAVISDNYEGAKFLIWDEALQRYTLFDKLTVAI